MIRPKPRQCGQAPSGELKENRAGAAGRNVAPGLRRMQAAGVAAPSSLGIGEDCDLAPAEVQRRLGRLDEAAAVLGPDLRAGPAPRRDGAARLRRAGRDRRAGRRFWRPRARGPRDEHPDVALALEARQDLRPAEARRPRRRGRRRRRCARGARASVFGPDRLGVVVVDRLGPSPDRSMSATWLNQTLT